MAKPIHSMIRILDEARSVAFYRTAFGLEIADRFAFDSFTLIYMRDKESGFEVELTINHGRTEPYTIGDGYGHLAFSVDTLSAEHERMTTAGYPVTPMRALEQGGKPIAHFFFVTDPDGYKIEVLQREGRYV
jgi:lactoylglutathione lyase